MGPLALMAKQAGFSVFGSDLSKGAVYDELVQAGIEVKIGEQDGEFLREKLETGVDWFVHTSALPENHPELVLARKTGVKVSKRDELTAWLVKELGLKMVAVAGTHGKTTTTAMIVWAALKLQLPASYIVGTTLGFAPAGAYHAGDKYFIYEADEYDRNFLKFSPWTAVITCVSYDHPDIYSTEEDYREAFSQFERQSSAVIREGATAVLPEEGVFLPEELAFVPEEFKLAGEVRRKDAALAAEAVLKMVKDGNGGGLRVDCGASSVIGYETDDEANNASGCETGNGAVIEREVSASEIADNRGGEFDAVRKKIVQVLYKFPGVGRRFERIAEGVYTDYAHHPEEIAATLEMAREEARLTEKKGVVAVYQPHQNTRQHEVRAGYRQAFLVADKVFWLPTYLTRENPELAVLTPEELISGLENREVAEVAELSDEFAEKLREYVKEGFLVLLMTAGPADGWLREKFRQN